MPTTTRARRLIQLGGTLVASVGLLACASKPSPDPALAAGAASLEAARAANAGELAAADMDNARQKLARARALAQSGQPREAIRLAEQADVDAQLARARAGSERTRLALAEVEQGLRTLREELARSPVATPGTGQGTAPGMSRPTTPGRTTP